MEDKDYKTLKEELNSTFSFEYCLIDISDDRRHQDALIPM